MSTRLLANYPIFSLGINNDFILISGGGGGKEYGIEDKLDVYKRDIGNKFTFLYSWSEAPGILECLQYSASQNLWIGYLNKNCHVFSVNSTSITSQCVIDNEEDLSCCKFGGNEMIITGNTKGLVCIYMLRNYGKNVVKLCDLKEHTTSINDVDLSSNLCISSCKNGKLCLWDSLTGDLLHRREIMYEKKKITSRFLKFYDVDKFGDLFISLNCESKGPTILFILHVYKIGKQYIISPIKSFLLAPNPCSAISYKTRYGLVVGYSSGDIAIISNKSWKVKTSKHVHHLPVTGIDFSDGENVVSGGIDFLLTITNMKSKFPIWFGFILSLLILIIAIIFFNKTKPNNIQIQYI